MNTTDFVNRHEITADVARADANPNIVDDWGDDWALSANHWLVTLRLDDRTLDVPFSTGRALSEPTAEMVLDSLASDAQGVEVTNGFEDWADDLGFDPDSRKAERAYTATVEQTHKLRAFLGDERYHELLETERD